MRSSSSDGIAGVPPVVLTLGFLSTAMLGCSALIDVEADFGPQSENRRSPVTGMSDGGAGIGVDGGGTDSGATVVDGTDGGAPVGKDAGDEVKPAVKCPENEQRCDDRTPLRCDEWGEWVPAQAECAVACREGECTECDGDGTRCKDGAVQSCLDGAWSTDEVCEVTCEDGACRSSCAEDALQCNGDTKLQRCDGTQYIDQETCGFLCTDGACTGVCSPDARRCDPDADNAAQTCSATGEWQAGATCPEDTFCLAGKCAPCKPGTRRCEQLGPQLCSDDGEWVNQGACSDDTAVCFDGDCVLCSPGDKRCNGDDLETCASEGADWTVTETCGGDTPACLGSTETCGKCKQGQTQCSGDVVQSCDDNGTWDNLTACSGQTPKCVGGECKACNPAAMDRRCQGADAAQGCAADGTWDAKDSCSGDTPQCRNDLNSRCGCAEDGRRCVGNTPQACQGGAWVAGNSCSGDLDHCLPASGVCVACVPEEERCNSGVAERCNDGGAWTSLNSCSGERVNCGGCDLGEKCEGDSDCVSDHCVDGACRPPEDCANGEDDDRNGSVDCADPACGAYICIPSIPEGWSGPTALAESSGGAPECVGSYNTGVYAGKAGLVVGTAACSPCECAGPMTCGVKLGWGASTTPSCTAESLVVERAESRKCEAPGFAPKEFSLFRGPTAELRDSCGPATGGRLGRVTTTFQSESRLCEPSGVEAGGGCADGGSCFPRPADPFGEQLCIYRAGDRECPGGFPNKHLYHEGHSDTRACGACSCGGDCGPMSAEFYADAECKTLLRRVKVPTDMGPKCSFEILPRSVTLIAPAPTCRASGGGLTGSVTEVTPTTICCQG